MSHKVVVAASKVYPDKAPMDLLRQELDGYEVVQYEYDDVEELHDALADCDAVVLRTGTLPDGIFERTPNLKMIGIGSSGFDRLDIESATEHGVLVTNNPEAHGPTVSEGVFALMLALIRDLPTQIRLVQDDEWDKSREVIEYNVPLLEFSSLGIVGLGEIGSSVAKKGTALFEDVIGFDPYLPSSKRAAMEDDGVEIIDDLVEVFERSDVVTLHTPLTSETEKFISEPHFDALDGYLINASRGGVIDENALLEALEGGSIKGAALDVLTDEPPAPDNPLLDAPNTIITPHRSGIGKRPPSVNTYRLSAMKIKTFLEGGKPNNMINPQALENQ